MQATQDQSTKTIKPPESIAEIIRRNPLFQPVEDAALSADDSQDDDKDFSSDRPRARELPIVRLKGEGNHRQEKIDQETTKVENAATPEDEDNDDYFISKPVNSAFEINIAEFPIAYLNQGPLPKGVSKTKYQYRDTINGRHGQPVERVWTVEAHATDEVRNEKGDIESIQLGFGGPATLEVIYELFQLWKEQGFKEPKIHIGTFYNLLQRLGWGKGNTQYKQLRQVLNCIHGLHIKGESCFYLPEPDMYVNVDFYPFYRVNTYTKKEKELNPDDYIYVCVDEEFFKAVKSNTVYYLPLDRFYFKTLKPMEQKLALMLAKIFSPYRKNQRFEWRRNIRELANQIPILTEESTQIRRQLKRTCEGLIKKNFPFLSSFKIEGDVITFHNGMQTSLNLLPENEENAKKDYDTVEWLIKEQLKICGDEHSKAFYTLVARHVPVDLIYQSLAEAKQEGKVKRKLYTKIILDRAKNYLAPYLKSSKNDTPEIPEEEAKRIALELLKEKESFENMKRKTRGEEDTDAGETEETPL